MHNTDTFTGPSFPLRNRLARLAWNLACAILFRPTPVFMHAWRAWLLRAFGARVGRHAHVYPGVRIWAPWNLEVGEEAGIADGVILYSQDRIMIGRRAVISQGAHLCTGTHDTSHPWHPLMTKPISVGEQSWVAAEAFLLPGVSGGAGAVIGARSGVTRDMPAWMICAGNPCRPLRKREWSHDIRTGTDKE
jgi:putative colanic acid biosynthesis acetyltransferase WcaF